MQTSHKIGILGATGVIGQRFIQLLEGHPWFEITWVGASDRSANRHRHRRGTRPIGTQPADDQLSLSEPAAPAADGLLNEEKNESGGGEEHGSDGGAVRAVGV